MILFIIKNNFFFHVYKFSIGFQRILMKLIIGEVDLEYQEMKHFLKKSNSNR